MKTTFSNSLFFLCHSHLYVTEWGSEMADLKKKKRSSRLLYFMAHTFFDINGLLNMIKFKIMIRRLNILSEM